MSNAVATEAAIERISHRPKVTNFVISGAKTKDDEGFERYKVGEEEVHEGPGGKALICWIVRTRSLLSRAPPFSSAIKQHPTTIPRFFRDQMQEPRGNSMS